MPKKKRGFDSQLLHICSIESVGTTELNKTVVVLTANENLVYNAMQTFNRNEGRMLKKGFLLALAGGLLIAIIVTVASGLRPAEKLSSEGTKDEPVDSMNYTLSYGYFIVDDPYVSPKTRQVLKELGKLEYIAPSEPKVEVSTQIPERENDAKGTPYVYSLFPETNTSAYKISIWKDKGTGMSVSGCYRVIGEMTTDELIKVYADTSGNIVKYETINFGKYDGLALDEEKIQDLYTEFSGEVRRKIRSVTCCHSAMTEEQTNYRIFTDSLGRPVITTTVRIEQEEAYSKTIEVELYAVIN